MGGRYYQVQYETYYRLLCIVTEGLEDTVKDAVISFNLGVIEHLVSFPLMLLFSSSFVQEQINKLKRKYSVSGR